jgi:hypothetical protein
MTTGQFIRRHEREGVTHQRSLLWMIEIALVTRRDLSKLSRRFLPLPHATNERRISPIRDLVATHRWRRDMIRALLAIWSVRSRSSPNGR